MFRFILISMLVAGGCNRSEVGVSPNRSSISPYQGLRQGAPESVIPVEIQFSTPHVREVFLQLDAATRELAQSDWSATGQSYPYLSSSDAHRHTYIGKWASPGDPPIHQLSLQLQLDTKRQLSTGFGFSASYSPASAWHVWVYYSLGRSHSGHSEKLNLTFRHDQLNPLRPKPVGQVVLADSEALQFPPSFIGRRHDKRFFYKCQATIRVPPYEAGRAARRIARFWESDESFREAALDELNQLEAALREGLESRRILELTTLGGPTGADPPLRVPESDASEGIVTEFLDEGLAQIERHRDLVHDHYVDLHAALLAAFPRLPEIVDSSEK